MRLCFYYIHPLCTLRHQGAKPLNPNSGPHLGASIRTAAPGYGHIVTITLSRTSHGRMIANLARPLQSATLVFIVPSILLLLNIQLTCLSLRYRLHPSPSAITPTTQVLSATSIDSLFLVYRVQVLSIPHYDGFKFSCVRSIVSRTCNGIHYLIENISASNSSLTAKAKIPRFFLTRLPFRLDQTFVLEVRIGMLLFTPTDFDFDFSFEPSRYATTQSFTEYSASYWLRTLKVDLPLNSLKRKPKRRLHIIQLVVQNSNAVSDAGKHFLLCDIYMSMKNQDREELYSSKKQSSTSQGFDLNAIKFRTTTYIKIDYSTRQARTRCWREAGPLGFMHRRTGLHRRTALRLAHCVRLGSAFGTIAVARELMNVGSLQRRVSLARLIPETNARDRALAHTRRLHDRALSSPHVALPDSCIVQGCALRVVHVLHPFDPPRHKSSSAHCESSARHALRRTAATWTRLGGGHDVCISTPNLGPAVLGRRQMEEKGREKLRTSRADSRLPSRILSFADLDGVVD
ncbi:hypothetical protein B0H14DRAFT_2567189 [Mycena olivaceomarginata]|nr:hypothetical protein B0H14DRAFT_2567189 [Mycena olivaceomarginata]